MRDLKPFVIGFLVTAALFMAAVVGMIWGMVWVVSKLVEG
jgi:hypothetical protein